MSLYCLSFIGKSSLIFDGITSGIGEIWLRNIQCSDYATSLRSCYNADFEHVDDVTLNETCNHESDVGIKCGKHFQLKKACMYHWVNLAKSSFPWDRDEIS